MNTSRTFVSDIHSSLLRFCTQMASLIQDKTGKEVSSILFDAYADEEQLPAGDFVGLSGLSIESDGQILEGSFMIGFSTQTDKNLFRIVQGMNSIFSALQPGERIEVVSAANGFIIGWLVIEDGTRMLPVGGKAGRPVQMVAVNYVTPVDFRLPS